MIIINNAQNDPLEVGNLDATDDTSADESSEEEVALPRRERPVVIYVIIRSRRRGVAELKSRTSSQLPLVNQSVSAVRRDNE